MSQTRIIQGIFGIGIAAIVVLAGVAAVDIWRGGTPSPSDPLVGDIPEERLQQIYAQRVEMEAKIKVDPKDVIAYVSLATIEKTLGNVEQAKKYLIRAAQIAPKNYLVLGNLAEIYRLLNDNEKARLMYERAVTYGPNEEGNYLQYAEFLRYRYPDEREKILAVYQQAIDHFDNDAQFYRARADYFESIEEIQKALDDWRAVLKNDTTNDIIRKKVLELEKLLQKR